MMKNLRQHTFLLTFLPIKSKVLFSILVGSGDLSHGPFCVANSDGTMISLLENTDMASAIKPLWCNNNVVYIRSYNSETEKSEWGGVKRIVELCYTNSTTNEVAVIDTEADYFAI